MNTEQLLIFFKRKHNTVNMHTIQGKQAAQPFCHKIKE